MAAGDGLVTMTPTSVAHAGTSATINADGSVDFTAVTSLSLNGVFTSAHDNYLIVWTGTVSNDVPGLNGRLRTSGTDASGSNYTYQNLVATSTTVSGSRSSSQSLWLMATPDNDLGANGSHFHLYGPNLAQPTAYRSVNQDAVSSARLIDLAGTHSLSTAYDGITLYPGAGSMTGNVVVFGYEE